MTPQKKEKILSNVPNVGLWFIKNSRHKVFLASNQNPASVFCVGRVVLAELIFHRVFQEESRNVLMLWCECLEVKKARPVQTLWLSLIPTSYSKAAERTTSALRQAGVTSQLTDRFWSHRSYVFNAFLLFQPAVTPSPPPSSQPAATGNHSPHLPAQTSPAASSEPSRRAGQNFRCLWQTCKRYRPLQWNSTCPRDARWFAFPFCSPGGLKRRLKCSTTRRRSTVGRRCTEGTVCGRAASLSPDRDCPSSHICR